MNIQSPDKLLHYFYCPLCKRDALKIIHLKNEHKTYEKSFLLCEACNRKYQIQDNCINFVKFDLLNNYTKRELKSNTIDVKSEKNIQLYTSKLKWDKIYTYFLKKKLSLVRRIIKLFHSNELTLIDLGAGAGVDLQDILPIDNVKTVLASDLSETMTRLVPKSLSEKNGDLGLFSSDFNRCPLKKNPNAIGIIFEALHHSQDIYLTVENLLDHFLHLILVEPITNRFINFLEKFHLAMNIEYSHFKPEWFDLKKIKEIANQKGYSMWERTFVEIPYDRIPVRFRKNAIFQKLFFFSFDNVIKIFQRIRFGSFAVIFLNSTHW